MDIHVYLAIQECALSPISNFDQALAQALLQFPQERPESIRGIVTQEYQKFIKANYRTSHFGDNRRRVYRTFVNRLQEGEEAGIILRLAEEERTSPALAAKIILEEYLKDQNPEESKENSEKKGIDKALRLRVNQLIKNHALVEDRDLAHEIFLAKVKDHGYGPIAEAIKQSIGEEYEQKAKDCLTELNIPFSDEHVLRSRGYDKTPDIKLEVPVAVNGKVINWIESKALFGDRESHEGYLKDQFWSYWNRFGPGLVIYWFGYIKQLDSNSEAGIQLADSFPTELIRFDPSKISRSQQQQSSQQPLSGADRVFGRKSVGDLIPSNRINIRRETIPSFSDLKI